MEWIKKIILLIGILIIIIGGVYSYGDKKYDINIFTANVEDLEPKYGKSVIGITDDGGMDVNNNLSFGFALTGTNGGDYFVRNNGDMTWSENSLSTTNTLTNNDKDDQWEVKYIDKERSQKIYHKIKNLRKTDITNSIFWYVFNIEDDTEIVYNRTWYNGKDNVRLYDQTRYAVVFDDETIFNFNDVLLEGNNISEVYIGDGSKLNYDGRIFGVGIELNTLKAGEEIILDPTMLMASYQFPTITGTIANDWTNPENLFADDAVTGGIGATENKSQTYSNFSLLVSEGGGLPDDHGTIFAVGVEFEVTGSCAGSGGHFVVGVKLSWDGGTSWTDEIINEVGCGQTHPFYGSFLLDGVWYDWEHYWRQTELNNSNFMLMANITDRVGTDPLNGIFGLAFDYVRVEVGYHDPDQNNVTYHAEPDQEFTDGDIIYHLATSMNAESINMSNILMYLPLDWEDPTNFAQIINYDKYDNDGFHTPNEFGFTADGCPSGKCVQYSIGPAPRFRRRGKIRLNTYMQENAHNYKTDEFGFCMWINRTETVAGFNNTLLYAEDGGDFQIRLVDDGSATGYRPEFIVENRSGTKHSCRDNLVWSDDTWIHLCVSYNSLDSFGRIWKNSAIAESCFDMMNDSYLINNDSTGWSVGYQELGFNDKEQFVGMFDEVLFVSEPLSTSTIQELFFSYENITYNEGHIDFPNRNMTGFTVLNISSLVTILGDASINVSIGDKLGPGYNFSEPFEYNGGNITNLTTCTPQNYSIRFWFSGKTISPYMNASVDIREPFTEVKWNTKQRCSACIYTFGDYVSGCDCSPQYNIEVDSGSDWIMNGTGNYTLDNVNISGFTDFIQRGTDASNKCNLRLLDGAVFGG